MVKARLEEKVLIAGGSADPVIADDKDRDSAQPMPRSAFFATRRFWNVTVTVPDWPGGDQT